MLSLTVKEFWTSAIISRSYGQDYSGTLFDLHCGPGLVVLYDIRPGNVASLFLQPRSPHGARQERILGANWLESRGVLTFFKFLTFYPSKHDITNYHIFKIWLDLSPEGEMCRVLLIPVAVHDCVDAVSDGQHRTVGELLSYCLLYQFVGFHVNRRRSFVKNEDLCFAKQSASQTH